MNNKIAFSTITQNNNHKIKKENSNRFSMRKKLLFVFGLLIAATSIIEGLLAIHTARQAVTQKIENHLTDKANDTAEILDGRIKAFMQFSEGIARSFILRDENISLEEKNNYLKQETQFNKDIKLLTFTDASGFCYLSNNRIFDAHEKQWFKIAMQGKSFVTEPVISADDGSLVVTFSVPVYDTDRTIIGVLTADVDGYKISNDIKDIVIGKTGECYILGLSGSAVAHKDINMVKNKYTPVEEAKKDKEAESLGKFIEYSLNHNKSEVGYYKFKGISYIASFATMKTTNWTVIIKAPVGEFMATIETLHSRMLKKGYLILIVGLIIVYAVACTMVKPIQIAVKALQNIAKNEDYLTVRLSRNGNDEAPALSIYFNQTIQKIEESIKAVEKTNFEMTNVENQLSGNISETAIVTEIAFTVEQIIHTIKKLNTSIENQAARVAESASTIEQILSNIISITQTIEKAKSGIKTLACANADSKKKY